MKTPLPTTFFFLILTLATNYLLVLGTTSFPEPLFDVHGNTVQPNCQYYLVSAIPGAGGIKLALSPYENSTIVRESTDLNLIFPVLLSGREYCNKQSLWKVDNYNASSGIWFVTTGGFVGYPGAETLLNWFKLEKFGTFPGAYKIVHCPSICES
ncbi:hypothetical protein CISIN_1g031740mg [Citrus sinensis]|uniref:Uncharacterized protein n=1 Tax=Citrus sinensis TaxID=2711 RepID=A0A067DI29_CITSI|nr:hypothetical protein CISIN_1g031740mg [Citrus sinensis]